MTPETVSIWRETAEAALDYFTDNARALRQTIEVFSGSDDPGTIEYVKESVEMLVKADAAITDLKRALAGEEG